ncbi:hypothetical protein RKD46_003248 [Streptomyces pseudovenezuelae]
MTERARGGVERDRGERGGEDQDEGRTDDAEDRAEGHGVLPRYDSLRALLLDHGLPGLRGRLHHVLRYGDEDAPADPRGERPRGQHRRDAADDAHQDDPAEVHVEQAGGRDRAGVRRQEGVGHRQARQQRQAVEQDRLAAALGRRVHDGREHEDADVEEDRDAEDEAGEPHREGRPLLPEEVQQPGRQHLGAAADFEDRPEHGAQADDDRDMAEDASHPGLDGGHGVRPLDGAEEFGDREAREQADGYGDAEQGDEGLESDLDDQEEQQGDTEGGDREEARGAVDEEEQATGVRRCLGGRGER